MGVLPDWQIQQMCRGEAPLISPFVEGKIGDSGPSYGLSSHGYDCRLSGEFWIPRGGAKIVDLRRLPPDKELYEVVHAHEIVLPPGTFMLAVTMEWFRLPRWLKGTCYGKSTLRRLAVITDATPLEAGWEGNLVLEINSTFPRPVLYYAGMGICQVEFHTIEGGDVAQDYVERGGKYQGQSGVTPAR